jgi:hypothetical protein
MARTNDPADVFRYYRIGRDDECWEWLGPWGGQEREKRPYFMAARRRQIAYRWVYELVNGVELVPSQLVLHSCDAGGYPVGCGNPLHMRLGTTQENSNDMVARDRHGLPKTVVRAIRVLLDSGRPQHEIATLYGISREAVSAIATNRVHKDVDDEPDQ